MGILTLLFALGETISETIREKAEQRRAIEEKRRYENIDFYNIESVTFDGTETAYRTEIREEFDIVKTNFLSDMDGWQHYETSPVEYTIEDGLNYCFTIRYKDGTEIYRKFHESSPLTEELLEYCDKKDAANANYDIVEDLNNVIETIGKTFAQTGDHDYKTAFSNFKQLQYIYELNENSTQEDFEKAMEIRVTSLITSNTDDFNQSIYELMLYLLSTEEDGDILEKTNKDGLSFLQQTDDGIDAFAILPKGQNIENSIVMKYDKVRIRNNYRNVVILTTGKNNATVSNPNVIIWDIVKICGAYISAFKRIVTDELDIEEEEEPKERFVVIDFETTGLNYNLNRPGHDEVISVAIIDQDENVLLNTYCDTIQKHSWEEAQKINGISPDDVKGYPTFVDILPKVIEIISSYDYVVAYNMSFEIHFLFNYVWHYTDIPQKEVILSWGDDPMETFMKYMNADKYFKLEDAAAHFGYKYKAHDALEDVKATLFVYKALREK